MPHAVINVEFTVPQIARRELVSEAIESHNALQRRRVFDRGRYLSFHSAIPLLNRCCVNHLRHRTPEYKYLVRMGDLHPDDYFDLKWNILGVIAERYPWLRKECDAQRNFLRYTHGKFTAPPSMILTEV